LELQVRDDRALRQPGGVVDRPDPTLCLPGRVGGVGAWTWVSAALSSCVHLSLSVSLALDLLVRSEAAAHNEQARSTLEEETPMTLEETKKFRDEMAARFRTLD